jgi:hypothetical protein
MLPYSLGFLESYCLSPFMPGKETVKVSIKEFGTLPSVSLTRDFIFQNLYDVLGSKQSSHGREAAWCIQSANFHLSDHCQ